MTGGGPYQRECAECSRPFTGTNRMCPQCLAVDRKCVTCGRAFRGTNSKCSPCRAVERDCTECGKKFTGSTRKCRACQATTKTCDCGHVFTNTDRRCSRCQAIERTCSGCGCTFTSTALLCGACRWGATPPDIRSARNRSYNNRYRSTKVAAEVTGPVPPALYVAIRREGPCVYCGSAAGHVDHVRPLARGGWEHVANLVPACVACNLSKGDRLLTEWRPDRVAYGIDHSVKVAAEWARLLGDGQVGPQQARDSGNLVFAQT